MRIFAFMSMLFSTVCASASEEATLHILAYHDVRDQVAKYVDADQYAISTSNLIDHFQWLRDHGFTPISVQQLLDAQAGRASLPSKPVLITFDDGFKSMYTHALPLLKMFRYPAVAAVVTGWIEGDPNVQQAGRALTRDDFMTWEEVRALQDSGLVEVASHSHDLHRGIVGNPQGNEQPAAVTRGHTAAGYESDASYRARVTQDLTRSAQLIARHTGRAPRVIAWPFGEGNGALTEIAGQLGMRVTLSLDSGRNALRGAELQLRLGRHLILANPGVGELAPNLLSRERTILRAAQVDLDYVYDPDPVQQEANLGRLLDRIKALGISHVFLQAFADPQGVGGATALYFPNRHLPMRADLFNRAAWQLETRANVTVYAWLPLLAFAGPTVDSAWRVQSHAATDADAHAEPRLSPFEPRARELIRDIYVDLAKHANFDGILFHDDGRLSDTEDANPAALAAARAALGEDFSFQRASGDPALSQRWAELKARAMLDLSDELTAAVRVHRPELRTARNIFASALLDPNGPTYLAQRYEDYLAHYDYTALLAMPRLENARNARRFYRDLARVVSSNPQGLEKTIFELQTVDWRTSERIDAQALQSELLLLQSLGVKHLAYYPDDFITGHPALEPLRRGISSVNLPEAP